MDILDVFFNDANWIKSYNDCKTNGDLVIGYIIILDDKIMNKITQFNMVCYYVFIQNRSKPIDINKLNEITNKINLEYAISNKNYYLMAI